MFMFTGSWRLHKFVGLDSETKWRLVLFCWHLLAVSLFCLVFTRLQLSVPKLLKQENKSEKQKQKIRKPSTYQITIERSMTSEEEDSISRSSTGKEDLRRDERVGGEFQEEGERVERVSPLEEFNTLYRNKDMVRASIKLKESNVI